MDRLHTICDIIILIGAVVGAIAGIINFISKYTGKGIKFFDARRDRIFKEQLIRFLPEVLEEECIKVKEDMKSYHNDEQMKFYDTLISKITPTLDEIKQINLQQNKTIEILSRSSKDVLREKIMGIYHANFARKILTQYEKEALEQYYKDYKEQGGNSYIDKYYSRMQHWDVIDVESMNT